MSISKSKRKIIIIGSILFLCTFLVFSYAHFSSKNKIVLDEHSELLSIWVEDSSGNFQSANSFPGAGYVLDKTRSQCENGGVLSGDGTSVSITGSLSDKCYLYFVQPWINTNTTRTLTCNSSAKTFDYKINGASFDVSTDADLTCTATKTANSTSQNFASYLISLAGTTQGTGQMVNENGYRFEGKDPNNYIWFNNEMWRIIGVFGSNRHGVANTNLVKIIRNQPIGSYAKNASTTDDNAWVDSTLFNMLNGCYFYALTGTDSTNISGSNVACSNYCYSNYPSQGDYYETSNCDFSVMGIQGDNSFSYRDMVQNVTWYLGGPGESGYTTHYPANVYGYETDSNAVYPGMSASVNANVGLMYYSDYGYSVLSSSCARGSYSMHTGYSNNSCAGGSWIFSQGEEAILTPNSVDDLYIWFIYYDGNVEDYHGFASFGYSVRPVVYLKSQTYKLAGTGTKSDPYVVGLGV